MLFCLIHYSPSTKKNNVKYKFQVLYENRVLELVPLSNKTKSLVFKRKTSQLYQDSKVLYVHCLVNMCELVHSVGNLASLIIFFSCFEDYKNESLISLGEVGSMNHTMPSILIKDQIFRDVIHHEISQQIFPMSFYVSFPSSYD